MTTHHRKSGYYWVIFPYPHQQPRWEPAGFDEKHRTWALIGSNDTWQEGQLVAVGDPIPDAPSLPPRLRH